jgi:hypothetical protein
MSEPTPLLMLALMLQVLAHLQLRSGNRSALEVNTPIQLRVIYLDA